MPDPKAATRGELSIEAGPQAGAGLDAARAWATLLPALCLVGTALRGVPTPDSAGAGWVALASLPAGLLLLFGRRRTQLEGLPLWLAILALCAAGRSFHQSAFDSFEADRHWMLLVSGLVLMLSGARLERRGRALLARGLTLLSALWLLGAALDTWLQPTRAWSGVLENTGDLAAACLPGALIAMSGLARLGLPAWLGGLGWVAYVLAVPVHGAALAGGGALALLAVVRRRVPEDPARRRALLFLSILIVLAAGRELRSARLAERGQSQAVEAGAQLPDSSEAAPSAAAPASGEATVPSEAPAPSGAPTAQALAAPADSTLGGVDFRLRTWARLPAVLADEPLLGLGPGQLPARFPLYRSRADLEEANFDRSAPFETEVEDLHNDWLEHFAQLGLLGGLATLAFLGLVARAAWRALAASEAARVAAGLAALGLLLQALSTSALLHAPASSAIGFGLFGLLLARPEPPRGAPLARRLTRALPLFALLLAAMNSRRALDFVAHGRALSALSGSALVERGGIVGHSAKAKAASLGAALAACPDSVVALAESADLERALAAPLERQAAAWERVLRLRPHNFEALLARANLHARAHELAAARALYEDAARVDARHPALLQSRLLLAIAAGDAQELDERLSEARPGHGVSLGWLRERGADCLRDGRPGIAQRLLELVDARLVSATGEQAYALQREFAESDPALAQGLLTWAHQSWAREHIEEGEPEVAVRSYRQSLRASRATPDSERGAAAIRLELAAALVLAERADEARQELAGWTPAALRLLELPEWAGQALLEAGLLARH